MHSIIGLTIFVGGLILAVLLFAFFIFPDVICKIIPESSAPQEDTGMRDPIKGFCSAVGVKYEQGS